MSEHFYVTTPIYYINDVPHLGSAYTTIAADVMCRYKKLRGFDSYFLTGTDEHGLKIQRAAEQRGTDPQSLADAMSQKFREAWPQLSCEPDDFIRTSSARHKEAVRGLWTTIKGKGDIYLGHYEGLYCVGCEAYYTDKELEQPGNLCPIHKTPAETVKEESYFFKLSEYGDRLLKFYDDNPGFVLPASRMNEVKSFVKAGLTDLSVSRTTFKWGVPVPDDDKHVMYVWFDALTNYWSALQGSEDTKHYWPASVHMVGKDILRFHAIFWPAFLLAAGMEPPTCVFAHGFLSYGGHKMSKSLRNTISPVALAEAVSPSVGVDTVRYCLMRSISFGHDGDFSIDDVLQRYASELGNTLGNLLNRVMPFAPETFVGTEYGELENELRAHMQEAATAAAEAFDACTPTRALEAIWAGLQAANTYVDKAAPWKHKDDRQRLDVIVTTLVEVLEAASVMLAPVMPNVAAQMRTQLGLAPLAGAVGSDQWPLALPSRDAGSLAPGQPIFPRLEKSHIAELKAKFAPPEEPVVQKAAPTKAAANDAATEDDGAAKELIGFEDFMKLELRVGVVVSAEKVKKKDRLLDLRVDVGGPEPRPIVAGIAMSYAPEDLVGKRVAVLCNLAPKKFGKGLVSHGMILAADAPDGVRLMTVADDLPPGSGIH